MTATILEKPAVGLGDETTVYEQTSNDPGKSAHIIRIPDELRDQTTPQALVMDAMVNGKMLDALCGHRWIPSRNPKVFPICTRCKAIFEHDPHGHGDRDELPEA